MERSQQNQLILNSTILFVIASTLEMTLHELAHFVAAFAVGSKGSILYHNYVTNNNEDQVSLSQTIIIKAAGPIVSLFIGIVFHWICKNQTTRNLNFLFNLYMSVFGYIGFFGYLMIAPIFEYGDTGYIFNALAFPSWLIIVLAVLGLIILYLMMRYLVRFFVEIIPGEWIKDDKQRKKFIHSLIFYPLLIGIAITTLLNLPAPTTASLIAPAFSPFTIMWVYGEALSKQYPTFTTYLNNGEIMQRSYKWQLLFVLIVFINRLLVEGFTLG
jgi:hypothetical protein